METSGRQYGVYDTALFNPFNYQVFKNWIKCHKLEKEPVLEPFAGTNSLIRYLQDKRWAKGYKAYDLFPRHPKVQKRNTLTNYPTGFNFCVSNPPWLYKSSAKRRKLFFPDTPYDDLYKHCTCLCLRHSSYVALLLPASFLSSGIFQDRLEILIYIPRPLFEYTESPVCLALFGPNKIPNVSIYEGNKVLGTLAELHQYLPPKSQLNGLRFNTPKGKLGLMGIDNHTKPSIYFCKGQQLNQYDIKPSSRSITRIDGITVTPKLIQHLNECLNTMRAKTHDVFLTTFKGLRKDGRYRRRLGYKLARDLIYECHSSTLSNKGMPFV